MLIRDIRETVAALVAMWLLTPGIAQAVLTTFTNEGSFLAAAGTTTLESFEGLADSPLATVAVATTHFTATPLDVAHLSVRSSPTGGHFATDGTKYLEFAPNGQPGATAQFDFSQPANSFGISMTDWGDSMFAGALSIATSVGEASSTIQIALNPPQRASGTLIFFGFIQSTPFTRVWLTSGTANDGSGLDEVYFTTVPEPTSAMLVATGAVLLGIRPNRRRPI